MPDEIKEITDDAGFTASLTSDPQKAYYTKALTTAGEAAVTKYKTDSEAARLKGIPDKYEFKFADNSPLTLTEDGVKIAEFSKKQGLTAEKGQELAAFIEERAGALTARQLADYDRETKAWAEQVKTDKELGGLKLQETQRNLGRVMDRFAPKDSAFRKLLDATGYGNHPEFVRFVSKIGQAMAEGGRTSESEGGEAGELTLAEALYGKTKSA